MCSPCLLSPIVGQDHAHAFVPTTFSDLTMDEDMAMMSNMPNIHGESSIDECCEINATVISKIRKCLLSRQAADSYQAAGPWPCVRGFEQPHNQDPGTTSSKRVSIHTTASPSPDVRQDNKVRMYHNIKRYDHTLLAYSCNPGAHTAHSRCLLLLLSRNSNYFSATSRNRERVEKAGRGLCASPTLLYLMGRRYWARGGGVSQ